ncbi:adenylate/guanylate cyclase domain-containing protein [Ruegeria arenilitoris]|uniref:adenylate/guanylate cyclase domain-containing protein n=1 Tax=Ruegeria arenilitoris TaxID=1173585 RepID=UPI00147994B7|nr:adenylate/guanylate cyclase domain-containing protein [Ruegeria arenilitoris]
MTLDDLFSREQQVLESAESALDSGKFPSDETRDPIRRLVVEYRKLLKTTRRMMRLSDRNERELNALAEKQRIAAEEISRKNNELEALSGKLAKYLSPQVYNSIFSGRQEVKLASQRKKLTVFFSDVAGFTELTDQLESEDLTQLLNSYLTEMAQVALQHGATIDKFIGDAILIFFGDPETKGVREDALACVRMAIAMRDKLAELQVEWKRQGIRQELQCRIGINTGYCTVGNFGSEDRMDYTIIGGAVNIASRLEHQADEGEIFISYETWAHIKDAISTEEVGPIQVKGVTQPVMTYRVLGQKGAPTLSTKVRCDKPNFQLVLDPAAMSPEERAESTSILQSALTSLRNFDS